MKYSALSNFMAFNRPEALNECKNLAPNIIIHLILVLIYPNDSAKSHWINDELITWLDRIRDKSNVKTKRGISRDQISAKIREVALDSERDVAYNLKSAIAHYDKTIPRNKVDISKYNIENLFISLDSLLSYCCDYVDSRISELELYKRLMNSFIYSDDYSDEEFESLRNRWKE